jgi:hypothetical protein
MAETGFATRDASQPQVVRVIEHDGLGAGTSSESPGSDQGASCRFQDDGGTHQRGAVEPPSNNQIENNPDDKKPSYVNPYTGLPTKAKPYENFTRPTPKNVILDNVIQGTELR